MVKDMKIGFFELFIGFILGLGLSGALTVKLEKQSWNNAVNASSIVTVRGLNKFKGFDQTYDLGYEKCQDEAYDAIIGLRRE